MNNIDGRLGSSKGYPSAYITHQPLLNIPFTNARPKNYAVKDGNVDRQRQSGTRQPHS